MVPNLIPPTIFGITAQEMEGTNFQQYGALVLEKYFKGFLDFYETDENVTLLNYNGGMENVIEKFISFIHVDYSLDERQKMFERLQKHSKDGNVVFKGDSFKEEALEVDFEKVNRLFENLNNILLEYSER